jgi:hypothetical protein
MKEEKRAFADALAALNATAEPGTAWYMDEYEFAPWDDQGKIQKFQFWHLADETARAMGFLT